MKRLLLLAGLAAAPAISYGDSPETAFDVVDVEYWGHLYSCSYGDCSDLPDILYGKLRIDLSLAPPDLYPDRPLTGQYGPETATVSNGFVTTASQTLRGRSADQVVVYDLSPSSGEGYSVFNHSSISRGGEAVAEQGLEVRLFGQTDWGIEGDGIVQQFDVRTEEISGDGEGIVQELLNGVRRGYSFVVDRLRVTPKVCRI